LYSHAKRPRSQTSAEPSGRPAPARPAHGTGRRSAAARRHVRSACAPARLAPTCG
jgi:hypothetical protein